MSTDLERKNRRIFLIFLTLVISMVGLSYASVPLYDLFCKMTGYGGTPQITLGGGNSKNFEQNPKVRVMFNTDIAPDLPWAFAPEQRHIDVHIGQQGLINFTVKNLSSQNTVGTAVYNVTPDVLGKYFHKTLCFCFAAQPLSGGAAANFPVAFYLDPKMLKDPEVKDIRDITLSYTFYPATSEVLQQILSGKKVNLR